MRYGVIYLAAWIALCGTPLGVAAGDGSEQDFLEMSLEELMDVTVVSSSRSEQRQSELAAPVAVLTAEEIRHSGLTTIPELLALLPAVDVRRVDRTRYIVGVRGLFGVHSDRTLVLIDGRNALNPAWGAPDWLNLPVMVEDIERIEVLRGPGGAVWGPNAFTGVINIITKRPVGASDYSPGLVTSTVTEYGDTYSQLRYAETGERLSWQASAGYEDVKDSDQAGAGQTVSSIPVLNDSIGFSSFRARDFARVWRFSNEFAYDYSEDTRLGFGLGYTNSERGDRELSGQQPMADGSANATRLFGRVEHSFDPETQGYLQWFGHYSVVHAPETIKRYAYYENDLEGQLQFPGGDAHALTVGGNVRWTRITNEANDDGFGVYFADSRYDEYWAGFYLVDRYTLTDRLTLESQGRLDHYSESGYDWSLRLAGLYALDEAGDHVARLGVARAFRAPAVMLRALRMSSRGLFNLVANPEELDNESTYAVEAGYAGKLSDRVRVRVDAYYQRMEDLIGAVNQMVGPVTNVYFVNQDGADAYGGEFEVDYRADNGRLALWYAYNELSTDNNDDSVRAYFPARHKVGLRYGRELADGWHAQANYIYNDAIGTNDSDSPPWGTLGVSHRLDLTLTRQFLGGKADLLIGIADLFNETTDPVYDVSYLTSYETPGRTFFARLRYLF